MRGLKWLAASVLMGALVLGYGYRAWADGDNNGRHDGDHHDGDAHDGDRHDVEVRNGDQGGADADPAHRHHRRLERRRDHEHHEHAEQGEDDRGVHRDDGDPERFHRFERRFLEWLHRHLRRHRREGEGQGQGHGNGGGNGGPHGGGGHR